MYSAQVWDAGEAPPLPPQAQVLSVNGVPVIAGAAVREVGDDNDNDHGASSGARVSPRDCKIAIVVFSCVYVAHAILFMALGAGLASAGLLKFSTRCRPNVGTADVLAAAVQDLALACNNTNNVGSSTASNMPPQSAGAADSFSPTTLSGANGTVSPPTSPSTTSQHGGGSRNHNVTCFANSDELRQVLAMYRAYPHTYRQHFAHYGANIADWCVSHVTDFAVLFRHTDGGNDFNADISQWDVSHGVKFSGMFTGNQAFAQDISGWNVSAGRDFSYMFADAGAFDTDLSRWDVSAGQDFTGMFQAYHDNNSPLATQLSSINNWNVSSGQFFNAMFMGHAMPVQPDLGRWDVAQAQSFAHMFTRSGVHDAGVGHWNVSSAIWFDRMFDYAADFTADISNWNMAGPRQLQYTDGTAIVVPVTMTNMLRNATAFQHNLCGWGQQLRPDTYGYVNDMFVGTNCPVPVDPDLASRGPWCYECY